MNLPVHMVHSLYWLIESTDSTCLHLMQMHQT